MEWQSAKTEIRTNHQYLLKTGLHDYENVDGNEGAITHFYALFQCMNIVRG